jgi:DNA-binding response OmpR family regulator
MNQPLTILVIDDEPTLRLMFRTTLVAEGYRVDEAPDGARGLEIAQRCHADLVLLDLQMPGLGGMEVLRRLREGGNPVPVVVVTAHGSIPDAVAAMQQGAVDFLSKPVTPDGLRKAVARVIRGRPGPGPGDGPYPILRELCG